MLGSRVTTWAPPRDPSLAGRTVLRVFHNAAGALSSDVPSATSPTHNPLFTYTAGRWLWNEEDQFAKRNRKFNVEALTRTAAASVGSASCVEVEKLVEGNFNKVFLLRMNDDKEVIAKLPNPNAGQAHSVTASEVATMDYVRTVLGVPVPKVLNWCSDAQQSPVEAEYVLMERAPGQPLSQHWQSLSGRERARVVQQLADFDSKLALTKFPAYGSLYFKDTTPRAIPVSNSDTLLERFVIGPSTERAWFDNRRAEVDSDCGPWHTPEQYFQAVIDRETACVDKFGMSGRWQGLYNPDIPCLFNPTATGKLAILSQCRLLPEALLASGKLNCSSTMLHPDLHGDNIFVDPESPTRITAIIDWQAVHLKPMFLQVRHPSLLEVDDPLPEGLELPRLPDNFDEMSEAEQRDIKRTHDSKLLLRLWEIGLCRSAPDAYNALRVRSTLRAQILALIGSIFDDGDPVLEGYLIALHDNWTQATSSPDGRSMPCPLWFNDNDRARQARDMAKWQQGVEMKYQISKSLGVPSGWDGAVTHAEYEQMASQVARCREEFLASVSSSQTERAVWDKAWPFKPISVFEEARSR